MGGITRLKGIGRFTDVSGPGPVPIIPIWSWVWKYILEGRPVVNRRKTQLSPSFFPQCKLSKTTRAAGFCCLTIVAAVINGPRNEGFSGVIHSCAHESPALQNTTTLYLWHMDQCTSFPSNLQTKKGYKVKAMNYRRKYSVYGSPKSIRLYSALKHSQGWWCSPVFWACWTAWDSPAGCWADLQRGPSAPCSSSTGDSKEAAWTGPLGFPQWSHHICYTCIKSKISAQFSTTELINTCITENINRWPL